MKFFGIVAIVSALTAVTLAAPVASNPEKSLDLKSKSDAIKSELNTATTTATALKSDTQELTETDIESSFIPFFITSPGKFEVYNTDDVVKTTWYNGIEGPFIINLVQGPDVFNMQPTNIFLHARGEDGSYDWHIPESLPDDLYSFRYIYKIKGNRTESYSEPFRVLKKAKEVASTDSSAIQAYKLLLEASKSLKEDAH